MFRCCAGRESAPKARRRRTVLRAPRLNDMTDTLFGVYGAGGHGREVMAIARLQTSRERVADDRLVFIDDSPAAETINGKRVLTFDDFLAHGALEHRVSLAVSDSKLRQRLADRCHASGVGFWEVRAPNAIVLDEVTIAEGAILSPFSMLTCNVRVGRHFHANMYSYVAHDCVIGDFVTLSPGAKCNGNVRVEDHAFIGSGAILRNGSAEAPLVIGRGAVVGMGAVVTRDVPPETTVVGNPARVLSPR